MVLCRWASRKRGGRERCGGGSGGGGGGGGGEGWVGRDGGWLRDGSGRCSCHGSSRDGGSCSNRDLDHSRLG